MIFGERACDLLPKFRAEGYMIFTFLRRGERHGEEEVHGSGDDRGVEADGGGAERGRVAAPLFGI